MKIIRLNKYRRIYRPKISERVKPTVGSRPSAEFGRGGRRGQVVHGGGGGVRLGLLKVALRPGGAHQARDGHAATRVLVAGVLQRVRDPPQVPPHLVQLLWLPQTTTG